MKILLKNAYIFKDNDFILKDLYINNGKITFNKIKTDKIIDCKYKHLIPGLVDVHAHFREPGYEYKETIKSGSEAALKGGVTDVFMMPNLKPCINTAEDYQNQLNRIKDNGQVNLYQIAAISKNQAGRKLNDIISLDKCKWFSDDGKGIQSPELMKKAMLEVKKINGLITAHCEDESELKQGACINEGIKSQEYDLVGINNASEYNEVRRDLKIAAETGCKFHICHISAKESVEALKNAKMLNDNISGEVTVHHLLLNENDISENHGRFKMNPPLRTREDQESLINAIKDNTIEVICTDHAPHSKAEKNTTFDKASMGIIGIEHSFSLIYTYLVKTGVISMKQCIELMSYNPSRIFGIKSNHISEGNTANVSLFDLDVNKVIKIDEIKSKGKNTPFIDTVVNAECLMTIINGEVKFRKDSL